MKQEFIDGGMGITNSVVANSAPKTTTEYLGYMIIVGLVFTVIAWKMLPMILDRIWPAKPKAKESIKEYDGEERRVELKGIKDLMDERNREVQEVKDDIKDIKRDIRDLHKRMDDIPEKVLVIMGPLLQAMMKK